MLNIKTQYPVEFVFKCWDITAEINRNEKI